jgi:hypothetical protein
VVVASVVEAASGGKLLLEGIVALLSFAASSITVLVLVEVSPALSAATVIVVATEGYFENTALSSFLIRRACSSSCV